MKDLGKLIVAKGFKKLPKVQKIAKSGHTAYHQNQIVGVNSVKRLCDHVDSSSDSMGLAAMTNVTGDTNLAVYSDLVSRAVKLARSFSEFSTLPETDQVWSSFVEGYEGCIGRHVMLSKYLIKGDERNRYEIVPCM